MEKEVQSALISTGYRFEREHPVGPFWVDFAVPALRLAIEAQGGTHHNRHRKAKDKAKRKALEQLGWCVVYIWNPDAEGKTSVAIQRREAEITDGSSSGWGIGID